MVLRKRHNTGSGSDGGTGDSDCNSSYSINDNDDWIDDGDEDNMLVLGARNNDNDNDNDTHPTTAFRKSTREYRVVKKNDASVSKNKYVIKPPSIIETALFKDLRLYCHPSEKVDRGELYDDNNSDDDNEIEDSYLRLGRTVGDLPLLEYFTIHDLRKARNILLPKNNQTSSITQTLFNNKPVV